MKKYVFSALIVTIISLQADQLDEDLQQLKIKLRHLRDSFEKISTVSKINLLQEISKIAGELGELSKFSDEMLAQAIREYRLTTNFRSSRLFYRYFNEILNRIKHIVILLDKLKDHKPSQQGEEWAGGIVLKSIIEIINSIKDRLPDENKFLKAKKELIDEINILKELIKPIAQNFNVKIEGLEE